MPAALKPHEDAPEEKEPEIEEETPETEEPEMIQETEEPEAQPAPEVISEEKSEE